MNEKRNALLSVYDKTGIVDFARRLVAMDFNILASGGTAKILQENGIPVTPTGDIINRYAFKLFDDRGVTLAPEIKSQLSGSILDHRVVTLSREIHGGLLARKKHAEELAQLLISWIHLVCVDFYPFEETIAKSGITLEQAIEQIDVGGPTMIHSAAKGSAEGRIAICKAEDREKVLTLMEQSPEKDLTQEMKEQLAAKADFEVSSYFAAIAKYRSSGRLLGIFAEKVMDLRYGENAHQAPASLYSLATKDPLAIEQFQILEGVPGYNNICDLERALQTITHMAACFVYGKSTKKQLAVGLKHGNPCGASVGENPAKVLKQTLQGDLRAIFGGSLITNFPIGLSMAESLAQIKLDCIFAPHFTEEAASHLHRKGDKCKLMANPALENIGSQSLDTHPRYRYVRGGILVQPNYTLNMDTLWGNNVTRHGPEASVSDCDDLVLAWAIGSTSNSNTVTLVKDGMLIGNGVGQQDRVGCAELALKRASDAGHEPPGSVAYSDSFFPFPDGPATLIDAGIKAILTSSGSIRDQETIDLCLKDQISLFMIPDAVGRGFYAH